MTTGIYQLQFKSGKCYYGQALDIKSRYGDHIKSMKAGTASCKMQAEYNNFGAPDLEVVIECDPAYLTYLENYVIYYNYENNCLNTSKPKSAPAAISEVFLEKFVKSSPSNLADKIEDLDARFSAAVTNSNNLRRLLEQAQKDRDDETLKADVNGLVSKEREYWMVRLSEVLAEQQKPKKFLDRLRILFMGV